MCRHTDVHGHVWITVWANCRMPTTWIRATLPNHLCKSLFDFLCKIIAHFN